MLLKKFYFCSTAVKNRLFSSYCSNVYLCVLWAKYRKCVIDSLYVAFNNAYITLHNLNRRCSASGMFVNNGVKSFPEMYRKSVYSLLTRLQCSTNAILSTLLQSDVYRFSSLTFLWHKHVYCAGHNI